MIVSKLDEGFRKMDEGFGKIHEEIRQMHDEIKEMREEQVTGFKLIALLWLKRKKKKGENL